MHKINPGFSLTIVMIALIILTGPSAFAQNIKDTVSTTDGQQKVGEIIKEDYKTVQIAMATGGSESIPHSNVAAIQYDIPGNEWHNGKLALQQGNYQKAAELYGALLDKSNKLRAIFKPHIQYNLAVAYQGLKQWDKAIAKYDELFKEFPDNRFSTEAGLASVNCYLFKGDPAGAVKTIDIRKSQFAQSKMPEEFSEQLDLLKGDILFRTDPKQAKPVYSRLAFSASKPMIKERARVGLGRCQLAGGEQASANNVFNEVVKESSDPVALLGAYTGLGDCYRATAETSKTLIDYKNALWAYLRVNVMYSPQDAEMVDEYCRASYYTAECFNNAANLLTDTEKQRQYKEYAKRVATELLASPYATNQWAVKADKFRK